MFPLSLSLSIPSLCQIVCLSAFPLPFTSLHFPYLTAYLCSPPSRSLSPFPPSSCIPLLPFLLPRIPFHSLLSLCLTVDLCSSSSFPLFPFLSLFRYLLPFLLLPSHSLLSYRFPVYFCTLSLRLPVYPCTLHLAYSLLSLHLICSLFSLSLTHSLRLLHV